MITRTRTRALCLLALATAGAVGAASFGAPALTALAEPALLPAARGGLTEYDGPDLIAHGQGVSYSADGHYAVFESSDDLTDGATGNLHHIYRERMSDGSIDLVSTHSRSGSFVGSSYRASVSADGRFVVFATTDPGVFAKDPANPAATQIALKDMDTGTVTLVSAIRGTPPTPTGTPSPDPSSETASKESESNGSPMISADGKHVAFTSSVPGINDQGPATTVPAVMVFDVASSTTTNISSGLDIQSGSASSTHAAGQPSISSDGRYVAFASGLVPDDPKKAGATQVYRWDRTNGQYDAVSVGHASDGSAAAADHSAISPSISADGNRVAFLSAATNLLGSADLAKKSPSVDAYVRDFAKSATHRVSLELRDTATPDVPDSSGHTPSTVRSRSWREAAAGASAVSITPDGRRAIVTTGDPLLSITGNCVDCQTFRDQNDGLDVYQVSLDDQARARDVAPISARKNTQDGSVHSELFWAVSSTTGDGDSIADGVTPTNSDGSLVAFGSQAGDLRGWDADAWVVPGGATAWVPNPDSPGNFVHVVRFLDGGWANQDDGDVRGFTAVATAFNTHLHVPLALAAGFVPEKGAASTVSYETDRTAGPALAGLPARTSVTSAISPSSVQPNAKDVVYSLTVQATSAGYAVVTLDLAGLALASDASIPRYWVRVPDSAPGTATYVDTSVRPGELAFFSMHLNEIDAGMPHSVSVVATVNGAPATASAEVHPAPPCASPDPIDVVTGIPSVLRTITCSAPTTITLHADHGTVTRDGTGSIRYTPPSGYVGADQVTFATSDAGGRTSSATIPIRVVSSPIATDDHYSVAADAPCEITPTQAASLGLLANDVLPGPAEDWRIQANTPKHGKLTLNTTTGSLSYVPNAGFTGTDSFRYRVNGRPDEGLTTNIATVTFEVGAVGQ